ncbi:hypothetical protein LCGC14_2890520, partial [marine sediment metagenome]
MLVTIPWSIPHSLPELEEKGYSVSFPEPGAVVFQWRDTEGELHP